MKYIDGHEDDRTLEGILQQHKLWLAHKKGGKKANFKEVIIEGVSFDAKDLRFADFRGACLKSIYFIGAHLEGANFSNADLQHIDFSSAKLQKANFDRANCTSADFHDANLEGAYMTYCNLYRANLRHANLRGVNIDFACLPIWCGGTKFIADDKLVAQLLAHVCSLVVSDKARKELNKIKGFASTSHRAIECGLIA